MIIACCITGTITFLVGYFVGARAAYGKVKGKLSVAHLQGIHKRDVQ